MLGGNGGRAGTPNPSDSNLMPTDNFPQGVTGTPVGTTGTNYTAGPGPQKAQAAADQPGADPTDPKAQAQQRKMDKMAKDVANQNIKAKKAELDMLKKQLQGMK